jgi:hypothetical protein
MGGAGGEESRPTRTDRYLMRTRSMTSLDRSPEGSGKGAGESTIPDHELSALVHPSTLVDRPCIQGLTLGDIVRKLPLDESDQIMRSDLTFDEVADIPRMRARDMATEDNPWIPSKENSHRPLWASIFPERVAAADAAEDAEAVEKGEAGGAAAQESSGGAAAQESAPIAPMELEVAESPIPAPVVPPPAIAPQIPSGEDGNPILIDD